MNVFPIIINNFCWLNIFILFILCKNDLLLLFFFMTLAFNSRLRSPKYRRPDESLDKIEFGYQGRSFDDSPA